MKPCPNCGRELPEEMGFCPFCMEKFLPETPVDGAPSPKVKRWWLWLCVPAVPLGLVGATALVALLVCLLWPGLLSEHTPILSATSPTHHSTTESSTIPTQQKSTKESPTTATTTEETADPTTKKGSQATKTTTKNSTTAPSTAPSSGTKASTTTQAPCAAGHQWETLTETVHHEEIGHYEEQETGTVRVTIYQCAICYEEHDTLAQYYTHFDTQHAGTAHLIEVFRDRYETDTEFRPVYEQVWVVDQEAYDETVTVGRRCKRCGKTEENQ